MLTTLILSLTLTLLLPTNLVHAHARPGTSPATPLLRKSVHNAASDISKRLFFHPSLLVPRQDACSGTCASCFGASYISCPNDSTSCYDPTTDNVTDACGSSADDSSSNVDTCFQTGGTCASCFGADSLACPANADYNCYDPTEYDEADGCYNTAGSSASSTGSGSSQTLVPIETTASSLKPVVTSAGSSAGSSKIVQSTGSAELGPDKSSTSGAGIATGGSISSTKTATATASSHSTASSYSTASAHSTASGTTVASHGTASSSVTSSSTSSTALAASAAAPRTGVASSLFAAVVGVWGLVRLIV